MTRMIFGISVLAIILLAGLPVPAADDDEQVIEGDFEVVYRNVRVNGSEQKYDEDWDALSSGFRVANFSLIWRDLESKLVDFARADAAGLGGDPYQRARVELGRKDKYSLSFNFWQQSYVYDLFPLIADEDGAAWDTLRRFNNVDLKIEATENIQVVFEYTDGSRTGPSLFMKDIQRDVFRLPTDLNQRQKLYTVGGNFRLGKVDLFFRQTWRDYKNLFENVDEGTLGIGVNDLTALFVYDWDQRERITTDITHLKVHAPLGKRVNLVVGAWGTLLGDETLRSTTDVVQLGTDFSGAEFGGTCAQSATACSTDATCDAIVAGDVCVPDIGTARSNLEGDHQLYDAGLSARLHRTLDIHLQYRDVQRKYTGRIDRDLDGDGTPEDPDGDGSPGSDTFWDYQNSTGSVVLDWRPLKMFGVRAGYRSIDRELTRDGFDVGGLRENDWESKDDKGWLAAFWLKPVRWFRMNAEIDEADITQPFTAPAPFERSYARVRVVFLPLEDMQVDFNWIDSENINTAPDFRNPGQNWDSKFDATSWAVSVWHQPTQKLDYLVRYGQQEVDSNVRVTFDQAGFFATETGNSVFINDNTEIRAYLNYTFSTSWRIFVQYWTTESDGNDSLIGDVSGVVNDVPIMQEYADAEVGLRYTWPTGVFVGLAYRDFEYEDVNPLLDYDGTIFTVSGGMTF